jgi:energy-converting hydrogenase Eha subunit E
MGIRLGLGGRAQDFFCLWTALELNTLGFICVVLSIDRSRGFLAKYLITQAVLSTVLIRAILFTSSSSGRALGIEGLCLALRIKLGASPFHS